MQRLWWESLQSHADYILLLRKFIRYRACNMTTVTMPWRRHCMLAYLVWKTFTNTVFICSEILTDTHDDVIKWKHFQRYWPSVRGIHRSIVCWHTLCEKHLQTPCLFVVKYWPIPMMTSSNGNIVRVTGHLCGEFTGPGEFPAQRPVTRSFDVFFDLHLNKRLSKQSWGWWFETLSRPLWRHHNALILCGVTCIR